MRNRETRSDAMRAMAMEIEKLGLQYIDLLARHSVARQSLSEECNRLAGKCYDTKKRFAAALAEVRRLCSNYRRRQRRTPSSLALASRTAMTAAVEEAWEAVGASFEQFCLVAGLSSLTQMLEENARELAGEPAAKFRFNAETGSRIVEP